jgi:hypothetical protein
MTGFSLDGIDQIVVGDEGDATEHGPLAPQGGAIALAIVGAFGEGETDR